MLSQDLTGEESKDPGPPEGDNDMIIETAVVPFLWQPNHPDVFREIKHMLKRFPTIVDASPGSGDFGVVCLEDGNKYHCLPVNAEHRSYLMGRFQEWVEEKILKCAGA